MRGSEIKSAYAILKNRKIFIQSYSKATTGLWIATGDVYVIEDGCQDELAERIRDALHGSIEGVRHPIQNEWKAVQAPMLEATGVKTWSTLAKNAKSVGLELDGGVVRMVPSIGYDKNGGKSLPDRAVECEIDNAELGFGLVKAFELCE